MVNPVFNTKVLVKPLNCFLAFVGSRVPFDLEDFGRDVEQKPLVSRGG